MTFHRRHVSHLPLRPVIWAVVLGLVLALVLIADTARALLG